MGPVVQGRDAEAGAQGVPVDGDGQVWGFASGGGAVVGGAGQAADLQQSVSVALRRAALVGNGVGGGTGGGELFDQRPKRRPVLSFVAMVRDSNSATASSITEYTIRDTDSISRT
ncbi:MAG TPA: hypothetical protein VHY21_06935 [Pseudonocardiaceae bacterium]|nr:hypothetical protein [Pseudonocardiaceae bacterium]